MNERPILFSGPMVRALLNDTKTQTRRVLIEQPSPEHGIQPMFGASPDGVAFGDRALWREVGPDYHDGDVDDRRSPYGIPGDRLWVRESWTIGKPATTIGDKSFGIEPLPRGIDVDGYRAVTPNYKLAYAATWNGPDMPPWRPSIHMPRWASRLALDIADVRVERLQDISEADALAEGVSEFIPSHERARDLSSFALALAAAGVVASMKPMTRRNFLTSSFARSLGLTAAVQRAIRGHDGVSATLVRTPTAVDVYRMLWDSLNARRDGGAFAWERNPWVWVVTFTRAPS